MQLSNHKSTNHIYKPCKERILTCHSTYQVEQHCLLHLGLSWTSVDESRPINVHNNPLPRSIIVIEYKSSQVKLGLPDEVAGATAGFGREVNMESTDETTQEETMTWSINSNIKV